MKSRFFQLCALCALGALCVASEKASESVRVKWVLDGGARVEASGVPRGTEPKSVLRVFALTAGAAPEADAPAMAGDYTVDGGVLTFRPQFPPSPGVTYRAVVRSGDRSITSDYAVPAVRAAEATSVTEVYPTAEELPENLLKFYVHFSGPMRRGHIYDHIRLLDESGAPVVLPFLEIDEELWDPEMKRLTLFIDPGRIKRGVEPLEDVGPVLVTGKRFRLVIDGAWKDASGRSLARSFEKPFKVAPPDRVPPDPGAWQVTPPPAGGTDPLAVSFGKPLDHALALRMVRVADGTGKEVEGSAALADRETRWTFTPRAPWRPGPYSLVVRTTIEDLAGNNIGKPFDVDLAGGARRVESRQTVSLPFRVSGSAGSAPR
jgi:hypothetical protein